MAETQSPFLFPVATSLKEAADLVIRYSFAIIRVDDDATRQSIQRAWNLANQFFCDMCIEERRVYHKVIQGHLHGFHEPSPAKMIFRCFVESSDQPWPSQEFNDASKKMALLLQELLLDCWREIKVICDETTPLFNTKRLCVETPSTCKYFRHSSLKTKQCPLDYFFYHGKDPSLTNCSEHVDRGVLICVCLSKVPGLEVRLRNANSQSDLFFCPEELQPKACVDDASVKMQDSGPLGLLIIMAGDQLDQTLMLEDRTIPACRHRVRDNLTRARLSVTYELRI